MAAIAGFVAYTGDMEWEDWDQNEHRQLVGRKEQESPGAGVKKSLLRRGFDRLGELLHRSSDQSVPELTELAHDLESNDFVETCKVVSKRLSAAPSTMRSSNCLDSLTMADSLLIKKRITVSIFAHCNVGKSTLLNAIMENEYLPVSASTQTGIRILIQHEDGVHCGDCNLECEQQCNKSCPYLEVSSSDKVFGLKNICERITQENKRIRDSRKDADHLPSELNLRVNIPLLKSRLPDEWVIQLVDNPGFGDSNQLTREIASQSWESSAAYLYLTSPETKGLEAEVCLFQKFEEEGLLSRGRLILAVNKIDKTYDPLEECDSVSDLCRSTKEAIEKETNLSVPVECILPISARWALLSVRLKNYQRLSVEEQGILADQARRGVASVPNFTYGQGRQEIEVNQLSVPDLEEKLYSESGLDTLKSKVVRVISNGITIWGENLMNKYEKNLLDCIKTVEEEVAKLEAEADCLQAKLTVASGTLKIVNWKMKALDSSLQTNEQSELWKDLTETFPKDIESSKVVERGINCCKDKIKLFSEDCHRKVVEFGYTPAQLSTDIEEFGAEMEKTLQECFDFYCSFKLLHERVRIHLQKASNDLMKLYDKASGLVPDGTECTLFEGFDEGQQVSDYDSPLEPPKLGDIKARVNIPNVRLGIMEKLIVWLFGMLGFTTRDNMTRPYSQWDDSLDNVMKELENDVETTCNEYFPKIRSKAIKFFHQLYTRKVSIPLYRFRKEYSGAIKLQTKESSEVERLLQNHKAYQENAQRFKQHLVSLRKHLQKKHKEFAEKLQ